MVETLDGTQNEWGWAKQKIGANAILAVSLAVARAGASAKKVPLYHHLVSQFHHLISSMEELMQETTLKFKSL